MQLSGPEKCPKYNDGKITDGRLCIVCRGSGLVHLIPAQRPVDPQLHDYFMKLINRPESEIYGKGGPMSAPSNLTADDLNPMTAEEFHAILEKWNWENVLTEGGHTNRIALALKERELALTAT